MTAIYFATVDKTTEHLYQWTTNDRCIFGLAILLLGVGIFVDSRYGKRAAAFALTSILTLVGAALTVAGSWG